MTIKRFQSKSNYLVGVISDTHGHLPSSVADAFNGVDLIIHAGDIGESDIIDELEKIALVGLKTIDSIRFQRLFAGN